MKSNTRGRIQEGATVELQTLIERGIAQEINQGAVGERRRRRAMIRGCNIQPS